LNFLNHFSKIQNQFKITKLVTTFRSCLAGNNDLCMSSGGKSTTFRLSTKKQKKAQTLGFALS